MSTRSNIIIKDKYESLVYYRHSDGYPTGQKLLLDFMKAIKEGWIRNNVIQASGWLIVQGYYEYKKYNQHYNGKFNNKMDWKVGSYEPTMCIHGDIEYLYILDLETLNIKVFSVNSSDDLENNNESINRAIKNKNIVLIGTITNFQDYKQLKKIEEKTQ